MLSTHKHHLRSIAMLSGVLAIVVTSAQYRAQAPAGTVMQLNSAWAARVGSQRVFNTAEQKVRGATFDERIALRMQQRLRKNGMRSAPTLSQLVGAVEERQKLLGKSLSVTFEAEEDETAGEWNVSAQRYPLFLQPDFSTSKATYDINTTQVLSAFRSEVTLAVEPPVHAVLKSVTWSDNPKVASRAEIEGVAKPGYLPDEDLIAASVAKGMTSDLSEITIPLVKEEGRLINASSLDLGDLSLWSVGHSDYTGSTSARKYNVQKALNEHVNNSIVPPGSTFSFNSTLDGPVSQGNGWAMAKVIYNGGDLEFAPGGGICQASTTVFRAAVNAGFPIQDRRAHSLYVSYYKKHGVGIDATIYPGSQDLSFVNDTDKPLVIQSYNDGTEAFVRIYGSPDGRTVALNGPYFSSTAPEGFTFNGRGIKKTEIVWNQSVTYPDGYSRDYQISSVYKTLPLSVAREYSVPEEIVHASAPVAVAR